MNDQFVPYEESIDLKELGFNEPCIAWFDRFKGMYLEKTFSSRTSKKWDGCTNAPLYQQVFRWFRKTHNLKNWIESIDTNHKAVIVNHYSEIFSTYEEAELACLKKLIKICKKN